MAGCPEVEHEVIELIADKQGKTQEGQLHPIPDLSDVCPLSGHVGYYGRNAGQGAYDMNHGRWHACVRKNQI